MSVGRGRICRWVLGLFVVAYLAALVILAIATFGLFGQPRDPLGAVYLLPLGLPWNLLLEPLPEPLWPWLAALAPALNVALLGGFCWWRGRRAAAGNRGGGMVGRDQPVAPASRRPGATHATDPGSSTRPNGDLSMNQSVSRLVLVLLLGAGMSVAAAAPVMAKEVVAQADMQRYCQGRAAEKYHVSPRDITTLPLESGGHGFVVYGQYPPSGANVTTFECHYGREGKWKRVKLTGGGEDSHDRGGDPVAEQDMARFCAGEASAAFDQRPQDILTLPLERDPGGYVVYGQYPPDGNRVTTFECHFDGSRVYRTVYAN